MSRFLLIFITVLLFCCQAQVLAVEWKRVKINKADIKVEVVSSSLEQSLGLGNRFSLPDNQGMLFVYDKPDVRVFWMKRMHFPIDIIWILSGKIVHIEKNVPPPSSGTDDFALKRYGYEILADTVLEVPAGYSQKEKFTIGSDVFIIH